MADLVVSKSNKLGAKVWLSIVLFGLMGQLAWMVENMYFSTYIQKQITDAPWATSATVAASAVVAALVTIFGGVLSDRLGKRKVFISWGYIIWGVVTASFAFFGNDHFDEKDVLWVVAIFVIMDCVMTVFGSLSNDAAFSSWVTDVTDITNRGFVDVILSIMPVADHDNFRWFQRLDGKRTLGFVLYHSRRYDGACGCIWVVLAEGQSQTQTGPLGQIYARACLWLYSQKHQKAQNDLHLPYRYDAKRTCHAAVATLHDNDTSVHSWL